jgi:hypothetical protein
VSVAIPVQAARLIERLERVAASYPDLRADRVEVERALQEHFRRLGLGRSAVRFVAALDGPQQAVVDAVLEADAWIGPWRVAWRQAHRKAWHSRVPWRTSRRLAEVRARRAVRIKTWHWLQRFDWRVLRDPADDRGSVSRWKWTWAVDEARCNALDTVVEAVTWSSEPNTSPAIDHWISVLEPLIEAFEAGLWLFYVTHREVLAVLRPAVRIADRQLHCEHGPAVIWPDGRCAYFWRGVRVSEKVVLRPFDLSAREIVSERNAEVRRVMVERYGPDRFIQDAGAQLVHTDETGALYRQDLEGDEPLCMVRVLDATPLPDGTRRAYWLRVPPTVRTAREAVAWTFGLERDDYRPAIET